MEEASRLKSILDKFPYKARSDQLEILTEFFVANFEGNQEHVRQVTGISQPTVRKIKDSFEQLSPDHKAVLIGHVSDSLYSRAINEIKEKTDFN